MSATPAILAFERTRGAGPAGTGNVKVLIASSRVQIGVIQWARPYRQYAFKPDDAERVYTANVLMEIRQHMRSMMRAWAKRWTHVPFTGNYAASVK